jgi:oxygen-independent coproporphyrinogen-3 oxidase
MTDIGFSPHGSDDLVIDPDLLSRFDKPGPRYTSYPTADRFVEAFDESAYRVALAKRELDGSTKPVSLYLHLPFCASICYYCACNKIITKKRDRAAEYVDYLGREMAMVAAQVGARQSVEQLHWGGGTPTYHNVGEMTEIMAATRQHFDLRPDGEYSIEIDPRTVNRETMQVLAGLGFNRISMGVQDFDRSVQQAVNRIQSVEQTELAVTEARQHGIRSVSFDLIYGLPRQNLAGFAATLSEVLRMSPDRIALYGYAHLPGVFKPQRRINEAELPTPATRVELMVLAINTLTTAGYVYIGMDHFAKPDDELARARLQGRLHRNFQGYSTRANCDLIGIGVSAIGSVGATYSQNFRELPDYYDRIDRGMLPVMRGIALSPDDLARRTVIQALMCHFALCISSVEIACMIDFRRYFATEMSDLEELARLGLVEIEADWIIVTPRGRLLVRPICMVFDRYLRAAQQRARYSQVV